MKVVWHCTDPIGPEMAGPGIRAVELARRLSGHEVTLCAPGADRARGEPFATSSEAGFCAALRGADVLVTMGFGFPLPLAWRFRGRLVLDLYDPVLLEQLAQFGPGATPEQRVSLAHVRARLLALLRRADHVLCASPVQRAFWLGWLGAAGRLTPASIDGDPEARRLLAVVPFGLPDEPPLGAEHPLRSQLGLGATVPLALFWGGMWDWMDPSLAVRAVAELRRQGREVHLAFLAGSRPGGAAAPTGARAARDAAVAAGVADRVHFLERWIPYADRGAVLLDADLAVTAHRPSLEAEFAFRTRLLDCLWARLPVATTRGDALASEAEREGWGAAAEPGDVAGLARAISDLLDPARRERARAAAAEAAARYRWSRSAATLLDLLQQPPPLRARGFAPGETAGASGLAFARALGEKAWRLLRK